MGRDLVYERLVVVGRFQPPHEGHIHVIGYALDLAREVLVVIGSAQDSFSIKNPLSAGERFVLLDKLFKARFGNDYCKRIKIIPIMDINMNKVWVKYLEMLLPPFEGVVTRNPLVKELFEDSGYTVIEQPPYRREICEGTTIRERVLKGGNWKECVPAEIIGDLEAIGFVRRLRELSHKD